jgi:DNA repair protein RadA/Sms
MKSTSKTVFACENCGAEFSKWMGKCSSCGEWNTLVEKQVMASELKASKQILTENTSVVDLSNVITGKENRISTGMRELDLVLNGGFVDDQIVLFSGEPGVGKSTLLLQLMVYLASQDQKCLYVSGEESASQVAGRAKRLFPNNKDYSNLQFLAGPGVHALIEQIDDIQPKFVVVDSIQTIFDESVSGLPGSLSQIKACTSVLVRAAKSKGFNLILVGHINKEGEIAGPKVLEHLVDTVLQFEGERDGEYRFIRVLKNRFGSTGEVGIVVMTENGLADIDEANSAFSGGNEDTVGAAKTMVVEGNRPMIVQVQALVSPTVFAYPKRVAEGVSINRLQLICAILERFAKMRLGDKDVYVRTTGGFQLKHQVSDLAVAAAIISSVQEKPISGTDLFVGELSLSGRVFVPRITSAKLKNVSKLGIERVISSFAPEGKSVKSQLVEQVGKLVTIFK